MATVHNLRSNLPQLNFAQHSLTFSHRLNDAGIQWPVQAVDMTFMTLTDKLRRSPASTAWSQRIALQCTCVALYKHGLSCMILHVMQRCSVGSIGSQCCWQRKTLTASITFAMSRPCSMAWKCMYLIDIIKDGYTPTERLEPTISSSGTNQAQLSALDSLGQFGLVLRVCQRKCAQRSVIGFRFIPPDSF